MKLELKRRSGRRAVQVLFTLIFGIGTGCGHPPPARPVATARQVSGDELFVRGAYEAAKAAYQREEQNSRSPEDAARARFLRAFVQLALQDTASAQEDLRSLEISTKSSNLWTRLARLLSHELARATVLHEAVLDAGAELHALRLRIQELESLLESAQEEIAAQQEELQALKDERARLQAALREVEERVATQVARVSELESALEALKNIDMERKP